LAASGRNAREYSRPGIDSPDFKHFKDFRRGRANQVGDDVIVMPGTHDERWAGDRLWMLATTRMQSPTCCGVSWSSIEHSSAFSYASIRRAEAVTVAPACLK
jgi:hypothetical protein